MAECSREQPPESQMEKMRGKMGSRHWIGCLKRTHFVFRSNGINTHIWCAWMATRSPHCLSNAENWECNKHTKKIRSNKHKQENSTEHNIHEIKMHTCGVERCGVRPYARQMTPLENHRHFHRANSYKSYVHILSNTQLEYILHLRSLVADEVHTSINRIPRTRTHSQAQKWCDYKIEKKYI